MKQMATVIHLNMNNNEEKCVLYQVFVPITSLPLHLCPPHTLCFSNAIFLLNILMQEKPYPFNGRLSTRTGLDFYTTLLQGSTC